VRYRFGFSPETELHLQALTARQRVILFEAIERELAYTPAIETRNRKPMRPNPLASWELRVGDLRVYYDTVTDPDAVVQIVAVGIKEHNTVRIGKEVFKP
jgi:mRNA-degrading endonuclease RelE of RelBE toxin-antitoxin system